MQYKRSDRVADSIRRVLAEMLLRELNDPRLDSVTVTGVELTGDLKLATVFFSAMGSAEKEKASLQGFQSAAGFIKKKLGKELRLRSVPDLLFKVDHSFEYGSRIDRLIETAQEKREEDPPENR
jgi:ribosome-binding factor A